jgi:stage V sporulation protein AF
MENKKQKTPISPRIAENEAYLKSRVGIGTSFDVGIRKLNILKKEIQLVYCTGLCDSAYIIQLIREELTTESRHKSVTQVKDIFKNHLPHQQVTPIKTLDEVVDNFLSGLVVFFIEGESEAFAVDVRAYPGRQPQEPDTEKVVRGSRDGYVENIVQNTALTRRRIRDERLRNEMIQVGERSKTDICISYLEDVADPDLIKLIKDGLSKIRIDGIPMADKTIEEFLVKQGLNPFPLVRYTERPDVASSHLFEGHVIIYVDTSPSVIITPTTLFHHVQHAEEYRQAPIVGAFLRWMRFMGIFSSIFILPLWLLFVMEPHLLPKEIDFIGPNKETNIPIFLQIVFAEFGIMILRMAAIHTPTALSTAMGLIAAVLIGQIAIDVGLFVPEVILYVAIAAIGSYSTPSYELGLANNLVRIVLLFAVYFFKVPGMMIALTLIIIYLARVKVFNTPYLWPFIPFNAKALMNVLVRFSVPLSKVRPSITKPQNQNKQPVG